MKYVIKSGRHKIKGFGAKYAVPGDVVELDETNAHVLRRNTKPYEDAELERPGEDAKAKELKAYCKGKFEFPGNAGVKKMWELLEEWEAAQEAEED